MNNAISSPYVIHLGKKSRKEIKQYHAGTGTMFLQVQHLLSQTQGVGKTEGQVLPIIVLHRKKKKKGLMSKNLKMIRL